MHTFKNFQNQKCLLFKIWRKSNVTNQNPCPQTDIVLGMAAVDLTVLLAGLPFINGWFNIIDYTGKCNGQIKVSNYFNNNGNYLICGYKCALIKLLQVKFI